MARVVYPRRHLVGHQRVRHHEEFDGQHADVVECSMHRSDICLRARSSARVAVGRQA